MLSIEIIELIEQNYSTNNISRILHTPKQNISNIKKNLEIMNKSLNDDIIINFFKSIIGSLSQEEINYIINRVQYLSLHTNFLNIFKDIVMRFEL